MQVMDKHAADKEQDDGPRIAGLGHVNLKELADRQDGKETGGQCKCRGRNAPQEHEYALVDPEGALSIPGRRADCHRVLG